MPPIYSEWAEIGDLLLISALWSTRTNVKIHRHSSQRRWWNLRTPIDLSAGFNCGFKFEPMGPTGWEPDRDANSAAPRAVPQVRDT